MRSEDFGGAGFGSIGHVEGRTVNKWIDSCLLGKGGIPLRGGVGFDKLVISRPERELVLDVLRFRDIDGRMPRSFVAFVLQVKGQHRRGLIFVADQEYFGPEFVFEFGPKFVDAFRDRFPSMQPGIGVQIAWQGNADRTHQLVFMASDACSPLRISAAT